MQKGAHIRVRHRREVANGREGIQLRLAARVALAVQGQAQQLHVGHAGNFQRVLKGQEQAGAGALFG